MSQRPDEGIADWVINELCDELECYGDEIVDRVRRISQRADTYEKAYNALGDQHFELIKRFCKMKAGIREVLPCLNCRMLEAYHEKLGRVLND